MTLILNLLTRNYVVQVSDRRLVRRRSGSERIEHYEDEENKAVLWCGRLAFAYTGLGDLGDDHRTDLWLAHPLTSITEEQAQRQPSSSVPLDQADLLTQLAKRCTWEFDKPTITQLDADFRRHAFVAVGWARFNGAPGFEPYLACVSNLYSPGEHTPLAEPGREFDAWARRLGPTDGGYFLAEGHRFDEAEQAAVIQQLGALDHAYGGHRDVLVPALIDKLRETAGSNLLVGKGLLVSMLPRASIVAGSDEHTVLMGPPMPDQQTFLYLPSDAGEPGVWHGPVTCCRGTIISGFKVTSLS